jgi:proline iminopeptidase
MRRALVTALTCSAIAALAACGGSDRDVLFPEIEPLEHGYLEVSNVHRLYWEVCGNPEGIPAIVLHGGPGGRAGPRLRRFFDPDRFHVLLFDQRGAGRSEPAGEWRENTTRLLVEDIIRLREHVGMEGPAILFGGSWGTTLALAFAENHPELVSGMVLRGVFLGTRKEIDHFYHGGTMGAFPDAWERLRAVVPDPDRLDYPRQLFEMIAGDDPEASRRAMTEWAWYEVRMSSLGMTDEDARAIVERWGDGARAFSLLENWYMMNDCFLEEDQLLRDAGRIAHIPTFIVHGRFDAVCLPVSAWELANRMDEVELRLNPLAGHSQWEYTNLAATVEGIEWVAERIRE